MVDRGARIMVHTYMRYLCALTLAVTAVMLLGATASAESIEEGGVSRHEMFNFEAFINHGEVRDGTAPFDDNDDPGYDSAQDNGIVRSWDTVTYPVRLTVNPARGETIQNIELEFTGELHGAVSDGRVHAGFAMGSVTDVDAETVTFTQEYTINQTGSSIMVPITVEVLGAYDGVELRPDISVQVVSVDGEDIRDDDVIQHFDSLPGAVTSADVSIKPYVARGMTGVGVPWYPLQGVTGNLEDMENLHTFTVAWGIDRLPGRSDMRGATFPDPEGDIEYSIDLSGNVDWISGPDADARIPLDFEGDDSPFMLFDVRDNSRSARSVGAENTLMDGESYSFPYIRQNSAPYSRMGDLDPGTVESKQRGHVWDSGEWSVDAPDVESDVVTYEGVNSDYVVGSTFPDQRGYTASRVDSFYGPNDKLFSSQLFLVQMPNEYRIGGPNNPGNRQNQVNYRVDVTLDGYTAPDGDYISYDKSDSTLFTEVNSDQGTYTFFNDFASYPDEQQLGTYIRNHGSLSKGDASTLIGSDVYFRSRIQANIPFVGGYRMLYRWNPDGFELTEQYAEEAEAHIMSMGYKAYDQTRKRNDYENQEVFYGVAEFDDYAFEAMHGYGIDDYTWFDTYDEALEHGEVSALQSHITAPVGPSKYPEVNIPLRVKHENIGVGATANGNPVIAITSPYGYVDADREVMVDVSSLMNPRRPATWNSDGVMTEMQSPTRGLATFETLAVVPAQMDTLLTTDASAYYSSDTIIWTSESTIKLPDQGVPENLDAEVVIRHELPAGVDYILGSGLVDGSETEPEIIEAADGSIELLWRVMVDNVTHTVPTVSFETHIGGDALNPDSPTSRVTVKSVIESDLDRRPESMRTSSESVTISKVGMVGVSESIDPRFGRKNSDFTLTVTPYTLVDAEAGVTGITTIPYNGDPYGSDFTGDVAISDIDVDAGRLNEDIEIYLNRDIIHDDRPHEIDRESNGWYRYTGSSDELTGAQSVLFHIDGVITNRDDVDINIEIATSDNDFGDIYRNDSTINSAVNYELSPRSNRVQYTIRPDLELSLERFQIYTNLETEGLPTFTRIQQTMPYGEDAVSDHGIRLGIYDESGVRVADTWLDQPDIERENAILIPPDDLSAGDVQNYEVRIEDYDTDHVWVRGADALDTDGYVSEEATLTEDDVEDGVVEFNGVVMTERVVDEDITEYSETLSITPSGDVSTKSGYGFDMDMRTGYDNEMAAGVRETLPDVVFDPEVDLLADMDLIDETLAYFDADVEAAEIPLEVSEAVDVEAGDGTVRHRLPEVFIDAATGKSYTAEDAEAMDVLDGGHKLYVPVWIDDTGVYEMRSVSRAPVGSHGVRFDIASTVDVVAYMHHHIDSRTADEDELLIHPVERDDMPDAWRTDE